MFLQMSSKKRFVLGKFFKTAQLISRLLLYVSKSKPVVYKSVRAS